MSANVQLGDFLRARRTEISPESVGLVQQGSYRRVAGLRREEVAQLAGVSTDYYTRLEQERHLSFVLGRRTDVLAANRLARAVLADFHAMPAGERNLTRWILLDRPPGRCTATGGPSPPRRRCACWPAGASTPCTTPIGSP